MMLTKKYANTILLVLISLLGLYYFSQNFSKIESAFTFFSDLQRIQRQQAAGKRAGFVNIVVEHADTRVFEKVFYSPLCETSGYRVYLADYDLRPFFEENGVSFTLFVNQQQLSAKQAVVFRNFMAFVDLKFHRILIFAHQEYVDTLITILRKQESLVKKLLDRSVGLQSLLHVSDPVEVTSAPDAEYSEQVIALPAMSARQFYRCTFEYQSTQPARPAFIVGQHPHWFVHDALKPNPDAFQRVEVGASPEQDLSAPVLILRNWSTEGAVVFRNIDITTFKSTSAKLPSKYVSYVSGSEEAFTEEPKIVKLN